MGLRSFFKIFTGFFLGSGVTSANFHERGRCCSLNDALRILLTGRAIRSAYSRRSQLGILSGPHDLKSNLHLVFCRLFFKEEMSEF